MKVPAQLPLTLAALSQSAQSTSTPSTQTHSITPTIWDGDCFYPQPDPHFKLATYPGRWYQVAGTLAPFTAGCKCISARYDINNDGSLYVNNTCQRGTKRTFIEGQAVAAPKEYGKVGVLKVQFPGQPPSKCDGPNYIVQEYSGDVAIIQSYNFSNLFILSKEQHLKPKELDKWIQKAADLGTNKDRIVKTDQTDCVPL